MDVESYPEDRLYRLFRYERKQISNKGMNCWKCLWISYTKCSTICGLRHQW